MLMRMMQTPMLVCLWVVQVSNLASIQAKEGDENQVEQQSRKRLRAGPV